MDGLTEREMPRYKCHKEVHALKIASIRPDWHDRKENEETDGSATLFPSESELYAPFKVNAEFMRKHQPLAGGYYVVYSDGYVSFSPAQAFEEGYTRV